MEPTDGSSQGGGTKRKRVVEDDSDDDIPLSKLKPTSTLKPSSSTTARGTEDKAETSDDEDISLADLKKRSIPTSNGGSSSASQVKVPKTASTGSHKASAGKPQEKPITMASSGSVKSSSSSKTKDKSAKAASTKPSSAKRSSAPKASPVSTDNGPKLVTRSDILYSNVKGELVRKLLVRWWHAIEWPSPDHAVETRPNYEEMDGYPGVYICVAGDDIGTLLDTRGHTSCPSFSNLARKSSVELVTLLDAALRKQREELVAHWGAGTAEERRIDRELKWLRTVNADKADKQAVSAYKRAKITG